MFLCPEGDPRETCHRAWAILRHWFKRIYSNCSHKYKRAALCFKIAVDAERKEQCWVWHHNWSPDTPGNLAQRKSDLNIEAWGKVAFCLEQSLLLGQIPSPGVQVFDPRRSSNWTLEAWEGRRLSSNNMIWPDRGNFILFKHMVVAVLGHVSKRSRAPAVLVEWTFACSLRVKPWIHTQCHWNQRQICLLY